MAASTITKRTYTDNETVITAANLNEIQDTVNDNAALLDTAVANAAPEYVHGTQYAVGDYALHNGALYRCTTAITAAEQWTAGHWTLAKIMTEAKETETNLCLFDDIPGTTQTVTFDASGNPVSIVHASGGSTVRTDTFVWGTNTVTETRTLADGRYITLTTNLATLVTTISDIQEGA